MSTVVKAMSSPKADDFPTEMKRPMTALHTSLAELKECLTQFSNQYPDLKSQASTPLMKAKIELSKAYAVNSLFWIYLTTKGVDARDHPIKGEIARLKLYMERVAEVEAKVSSSQTRVDAKAAKRFVKSALWQPSAKDSDQSSKRKLNEESEEIMQSTNKVKQKAHKKFKSN